MGSQKECPQLRRPNVQVRDGDSEQAVVGLREETGLHSFWRSNKQDLATLDREYETIICFLHWLSELNEILLASFYRQRNRLSRA